MGRKKGCPDCGSKKLSRMGNQLKCKVCGHEFRGQKRKTLKKERRGW